MEMVAALKKGDGRRLRRADRQGEIAADDEVRGAGAEHGRARRAPHDRGGALQTDPAPANDPKPI